MESFLLRHVPKLDSQWEGASEDDIRAIEELAGQPLPRFYQWFLSRMGGSPGHLVRFKNFTASAVLSNYRQGLAESEAGLLQIAIEPDDVMPTAVYYDLNRPVRDDAVVMVGAADGGDLEDDFETFREMMGWYTLNAYGIDSAEQHCKGIIRGSDVSEQLGQVLANIGFDNPIPTGPYCCIAERSDAAMIGVVSPYERNKGFLIFRLGGKDVGSLRRILGRVSTESSVEIEIDKWDPPIED
jgi:hypothetical protein